MWQNSRHSIPTLLTRPELTFSTPHAENIKVNPSRLYHTDVNTVYLSIYNVTPPRRQVYIQLIETDVKLPC